MSTTDAGDRPRLPANLEALPLATSEQRWLVLETALSRVVQAQRVRDGRPQFSQLPSITGPTPQFTPTETEVVSRAFTLELFDQTYEEVHRQWPGTTREEAQRLFVEAMAAKMERNRAEGKPLFDFQQLATLVNFHQQQKLDAHTPRR